jgi:hypothetical protein
VRPLPQDGEEEDAQAVARRKALEQDKEEDAFSSLFEGAVLFLSREVPRASLEFVSRSLGARPLFKAVCY